MKIELLSHHVRPVHPHCEAGVFDGWKRAGIQPTMREIQRKITPRLKENGFSFLRKKPKQKKLFERSLLVAYRAYLDGDYQEIPDFDPKTGKHNKGYLCRACPNWEESCRHKTRVKPKI